MADLPKNQKDHVFINQKELIKQINDKLNNYDSLEGDEQLRKQNQREAFELISYILDNKLLSMTIQIENSEVYGECGRCKKLLIRTDRDPVTKQRSVFQLNCNHYFHKSCLQQMILNRTQNLPTRAQNEHICEYCQSNGDRDTTIFVYKNMLDEIFDGDVDYYPNHKDRNPNQEGQMKGGNLYNQYQDKNFQELNVQVYKCAFQGEDVQQSLGQSGKYIKLACGHGFCGRHLYEQILLQFRNQGNMLCPAKDCGFYLLTDEILYNCNSEITKNDLKNSQCVYALQYQYSCPSNVDQNNQSCDGMLNIPVLNQQRNVQGTASCSKCRREFCTTCFEQKHENTCEERRKELEQGFKGALENNKEYSFSRNNTYIRCPTCFALFNKGYEFEESFRCGRCQKKFDVCYQCEPPRPSVQGSKKVCNH